MTEMTLERIAELLSTGVPPSPDEYAWLLTRALELQAYDELRRGGISVGAAQQATHMAKAACEALRLDYDETAPADITAAVRALEQDGAYKSLLERHKASQERVMQLEADLRALEQPVPTGEVTREHREAALAIAEIVVGSKAQRLEWSDCGTGPLADASLKARFSDVALTLALLQQAAYQRGRREAQGDVPFGERCVYEQAVLMHLGWLDSEAERFIRNPQAHRTFRECAGRLRAALKDCPVQEAQGGWVAVIQDAYDSLTDGDAEGAIRTLRAALPPPPSDTGKGGGA